MSRFIDLTGQRFGMLSVLHRSEQTHSRVYWSCRCDCGRVIEISGNNLKQGHHVSCGCRRVLPYIGKRFGMLTVLEKTKETVRHGSTHSPLWKCRCDCGNITLVRLDSLTGGNIKSCGCMEDEGKTQKMRKAARFVDGTQVSKILRIMEYNASASDENMIGVTYDRRRRKWNATLIFRGVRHRLGSYDTPSEAAAARRKGEREWFGHFLQTLPSEGEKDIYNQNT